MAARLQSSDPAPPACHPAHDPPLEPDALTDPDDQGLSLDELSQAYAALLAKGADPYPDAPSENVDQEAESTSSASPPVGAAILEEPPPISRGADDAACEVTPRSILEAMLFVGHPLGEPLTSERIAGLMRGVRPAEIDELVVTLNDEYAASGAPYEIVSVGPGYQLALRAEFGPLRDAFYGRMREARLSQAAIDILAIVAYHQPVTADEIERRRGKPSGAIISQLVRRDLLALEPKRERKAKPQYRTTGRFLQLFDLDNLSELPRSHDIDRNL